jgi:hypothetical protein
MFENTLDISTVPAHARASALGRKVGLHYGASRRSWRVQSSVLGIGTAWTSTEPSGVALVRSFGEAWERSEIIFGNLFPFADS